MLEEKRTKKQIVEEISQWKMLRDAGPEMVEETRTRIEELKIKMSKASKDDKVEIQKDMNELQYIFMQTSKNLEIAPSMIIKLEEEWRKVFRIEMAENYSKTIS